MHKKVLFAVGGTGGHLFPAQALAKELKEQDQELDILFGGGRLGSNPFFHKLQFPFREITSGTPFRQNPFKALMQLAIGVRQSLSLFQEFPPDLIIGFGSFYSFPLLAAARLKKIPYILVESNALPGKVNRLFAKGARFSAIQFPQTPLKGKTTLATMPQWSQENPNATLPKDQARKYFGLDPETFTLLIFGGSQGARILNEAMLEIAHEGPFQVIHLCGKNQDREALQKKWTEKEIPAYVKHFEEKMHLAFLAADLVISRAGAGTVAEVIAHETPAILVPWPGATDKHQHKNAQVLVEKGGALLLEETHLPALSGSIAAAKEKLKDMRENLQTLKKEEKESLSTIVMRQLQ